jgi:purine-binding chemotaxis protein CheW
MSVIISNNEVPENSPVEELLQIVTFNVGNEKFGVDILKVKEIIRMTDITKVPNTPNYVDGVINLRGKVMPIINIRSKFGMPRVENDSSTRIIIFELESKHIGFIVDAVNAVLKIPKSLFETPPEIIVGIDAKYITSVGIWNNQMTILLDLDKILTTSKQEVLVDAV